MKNSRKNSQKKIRENKITKKSRKIIRKNHEKFAKIKQTKKFVNIVIWRKNSYLKHVQHLF